MEKVLNYTLDFEGVYPAEPICAGHQGEHRATAITFTPTEELVAEISQRQALGSGFLVKTEFVTEAGEIFLEEKDISVLGEPFFISSDMSQSGLDSRVILTLVETDANGNKSEFIKATAELYFLKGRGYGDKVSKKKETDLVAEKTAEALLLIEGKIAEAEGFISDGVSRMQKIQQLSADQLKKTISAAESASLAEGEAENLLALCRENYNSTVAVFAETKDYIAKKFGDITEALNTIIEIQNFYIGGEEA